MSTNRYITIIAGICILVLLCSGFPKKKVVERRILFVGNDITNAHGMTGMLQHMLDEQQQHVAIRDNSEQGYSFYLHLTMVKRSSTFSSTAKEGEIPNTVAAISNGPWDMVVVQETLSNILITELKLSSAVPSLHYMDSLVRRAKSKTVLFQPCTNARFPKQHCWTRNNQAQSDIAQQGGLLASTVPPAEYCSDNFASSTEQFKTIQKVCKDLAGVAKAPIVPVGAAYELCKKKQPTIGLYDTTGHPSKQGAYLTACMFFRYIAKKKVTGIKYCADVNAAEAKQLREIADAMAMN